MQTLINTSNIVIAYLRTTHMCILCYSYAHANRLSGRSGEIAQRIHQFIVPNFHAVIAVGHCVTEQFTLTYYSQKEMEKRKRCTDKACIASPHYGTMHGAIRYRIRKVDNKNAIKHKSICLWINPTLKGSEMTLFLCSFPFPPYYESIVCVRCVCVSLNMNM